MTNEQAIELLNRISDSQFDGIHGDERREALEMAVRALSGDGDMISRQAVMKEFSDFVRKSNNSDFAPTPTWNDAVSLVGSIPSAQPTYTDEEIQKMQDLESAEIEKAYQLGYEEGKKVAQPEYELVTAEDFAKTMSENTLYGFIVWHCEALVLMKEQGFVICKKTM